MTEGYVTPATGALCYFEMASAFALSAHLNDPSRPVCLVTDKDSRAPEFAAEIFDQIVRMPTSTLHIGCANKIRLYDFAPFDRNMYVDADCLFVKRDIEHVWRAAEGSAFTMTGDKRTSGKWGRLDISWACRHFGIPYVVAMNSGVWERCTRAAEFFAYVNHLFDRHREEISNIHQRRPGQYADEPLFGVAMGHFGIAPLDTPDEIGDGNNLACATLPLRCLFRRVVPREGHRLPDPRSILARKAREALADRCALHRTETRGGFVPKRAWQT